MAQAAFLGEIIKIIAKHYRNNREAKGKEILDLVNADPDMKGRTISLSAVQTQLAKWHADEKKRIAEGTPTNPLDQLWTIGLSMKCGIPADMLPIIIQEQHIVGQLMTIREARWLAYLYPTLSPMFKKQHPDFDSTQVLNEIAYITEQYASQEAVSEIVTGKISPVIIAPDTSALDESYFINQDLSEETIADNELIVSGLFSKEELKETKKFVNSHTPEELEKAFHDVVNKEGNNNER